MFKPNVSPLLLDQVTTTVPKVITLKTGERVIQDPEATTERVMLWFYLMINIGGFMGVATAYSEKYIGVSAQTQTSQTPPFAQRLTACSGGSPSSFPLSSTCRCRSCSGSSTSASFCTLPAVAICPTSSGSSESASVVAA
jgi:hypothetical protein